jgi:hypothetical protein
MVYDSYYFIAKYSLRIGGINLVDKGRVQLVEESALFTADKLHCSIQYCFLYDR